MSCCSSKLIHSGGGHSSGCCNEVIYDYSTHCCENKAIVPKVSIWRCILDQPAGRCWDFTVGWFTCPIGWRGRHSYVCLDGPNSNCWAAYSDGVWDEFNPFYPFGGSDEGYTRMCNENKVCPSEKAEYGKPKKNGYNGVYNNCHHQAGNCSNIFSII